jgi:hypothetical protein
MQMELYTIIELVLGGGLVATLAGLVTMRSSVRKARAEADSARAEADKAKAEIEGVQLTNAENATRILNENIVKPLKKELNETRNYLEAAKRETAKSTREMARLRKAIDAANSCHYSDDCPVLERMQRDKKREQREEQQQQSVDDDTAGQPEASAEDYDAGAGADEYGDSDGSGG